MKEGLLELKKSSKARENSWLARFRSQNSPLRNRHFVAKLFRSPKKSLWNRHYAAKSFHSPMPPSAKIFAAAKPLLGTRVPFAASYPHFVVVKWLWNPQFSQPKPHLVGCFAATKHPFGTRVPFRNTVPSFRSSEIGCENAPSLWKWPSVAKSTLLCEN